VKVPKGQTSTEQNKTFEEEVVAKEDDKGVEVM